MTRPDRSVVGRLVCLVLVAAAVGLSSGTAIAGAVPVAGVAPGVVTGGGGHFCVLTSAGGAKCWGYNATGGLGDGTTVNRLVPTPVTGLASGLASIDAGGQSTCAVTTAGGAKCWGANGKGQVGDGSSTNRTAPADVAGLTSGVAAVSVGYYHACALTTGGGVKCWGANNNGQLGDGTTADSHTPVDVVGLTSGVVAIATGLDDSSRDHTCALTDAGAVKCWGTNTTGQLGDGTNFARTSPVDVVGLSSGVSAIYAGGMHTCAVTDTGGAKCWGDNDGGQLGDGTTTERSTPVDVVGLGSGVASMSLSQSSTFYGSRRSHSCAVTTAGSVLCWGRNSEGQAGDGTIGGDHLTPAEVPGVSDAIAVGTTFASVCVAQATGAVRCWGGNSLGEGTGLQRLTPVDISGSFFRPECPTIVASPHTRFSLADGYAVGSVASFTPDAGYLLIGSPTAVCQSDTTWSSVAPIASTSTNPTVLPGNASRAEGASGTATLSVPVTLSKVTGVTVTVEWTTLFVAGTSGAQADPATDYSPASGTVTFAPGQTARSVSIPIAGDALVEPDEYIVVSFHDPVNARMGGFWGLGFGGITNDDHAVVLPGAASVLEGDAGTASLLVPVTLSNPSTAEVTVEWTTLVAAAASGDQADPASDYTAASGTVTFAPGETSASVSIEVAGDDVVEPDEFIVVSFHDPLNARMGGFWGLGFGGITNDD